MPGISFYKCQRLAPPNIQSEVLGANLDGSATAKPFIFAGDPLVPTQNATYRTSADVATINNFRPLLQADATALYKEGANTVGVFGIAAWDARTDANALSTLPVVASGVASNVPATYPLAGVSASYDAFVDPQTPTIIHARMSVILADQFNVFRGILGGAGDTTPQIKHIGKMAGIVVTASGAPNVQNTYRIDTSLNTVAGGACLVIVGLDTEDPANNAVLFQFLPAFQGINTGFVYTSN